MIINKLKYTKQIYFLNVKKHKILICKEKGKKGIYINDFVFSYLMRIKIVFPDSVALKRTSTDIFIIMLYKRQLR